jgi:hypothetical protein
MPARPVTVFSDCRIGLPNAPNIELRQEIHHVRKRDGRAVEVRLLGAERQWWLVTSTIDQRTD